MFQPPKYAAKTAGCGCSSAKAGATYSLPAAPSSSPTPTPSGGMVEQRLGRAPRVAPTQAARPAADAQVEPPVCYGVVDGGVVAVDCRLQRRDS
jgi:hypothetical protein